MRTRGAVRIDVEGSEVTELGPMITVISIRTIVIKRFAAELILHNFINCFSSTKNT